MNNLTGIQISSKLAKAIDWPDKDIEQTCDGVSVNITQDPDNHLWMPFDYRDPTVIYTIAAKYDCYPHAIVGGDYALAKKHDRPIIHSWECCVWSYKNNTWVRVTSDTPQKAIALAIINRDSKHESGHTSREKQSKNKKALKQAKKELLNDY